MSEHFTVTMTYNVEAESYMDAADQFFEWVGSATNREVMVVSDSTYRTMFVEELHA